MLCNRYNYLLKVYPTQSMNYFSSSRSLLSPSRATIGSGRWRGSADDIPRTRGLIRRVFTRASRIIAGAKRRNGGECVWRRWWMNVCRCIERDQWTSSITLNPLVTADYPHRVRLTASLFNNQNRYSFSKSAIFPVQTQIQYRWFKCLLSPPPLRSKTLSELPRAHPSPRNSRVTNELIARIAIVPFIYFFRLQRFVNASR